MAIYKTKDEALKEIQTRSSESSLGIPPRKLSGTLNQIPKERRYGIKDIIKQTTRKIDSYNTDNFQRESEKLSEMYDSYTGFKQSEPQVKSFISPKEETVDEPKQDAFSNTFKELSFDEVFPGLKEKLEKQKKLEEIQPIYEPPEPKETDNFTDFGLGIKKVINYFKAFVPSAVFSDEEDIKKIENIHEENKILQEQVKKTGGGRFLEKFDEMWKNNDGFMNVSKKMASLIFNNPKEAVNLVTQELPVVAVPLMFTPVGLGVNMLLRGGLVMRSILTGTSLFAGNKVIEQGAMAISAAEGGLTKEELDKVRSDSSIKSGVLTAVDIATFKLGSRFFTNNLAKDIDTEVYKVFKRDGKNFNNVNSEIQQANKEILNEVVEKNLPKEEAIKLYEDKIQEILVKNNISDELIKKSNDAIQNRLNYFEKSLLKQPKEVSKIVGNFSLQTLGEGGGEYLGSAAIGEADLQGAVLEGFVGGSVSLAEVIYQGITGKRSNRAAKASAEAKLEEGLPFDQQGKDIVSKISTDQVETEETKEEVKEEVKGTPIKNFTGDEKFLDNILNAPEMDSYLAGYIVSVQGDEDIPGEALVDPIYRAIDAHDKKFPDAKLRQKVDALVTNPQKANEVMGKAFLVSKLTKENFNEEGELNIQSLGLSDRDISGIDIKTIVNTAQKIYPLNETVKEESPEIQSEPLQVQDITIEDDSQSKQDIKNAIALSESEPRRVTYSKVGGQDINKESYLSLLNGTQFKGKKYRGTFDGKNRGEQIENQILTSEEKGSVEQFKNILVNTFVTDQDNKESIQNKNAVVNLADITSEEKYIRERFKFLFDTDVIFVTDMSKDSDGNFTEDNDGFIVDGSNSPYRLKATSFVSDTTKRNTIVVNVNEVNTDKKETKLDAILAHELSHALEDTQIFSDQKFTDIVKEYYENNQEKANQIETAIRNIHTGKKGMTEEKLNKMINSELFAYLVQEAGDNKFFWNNVYSDIYEKIYGKDKNLAEKFKEQLQQFFKKIQQIFNSFTTINLEITGTGVVKFNTLSEQDINNEINNLESINRDNKTSIKTINSNKNKIKRLKEQLEFNKVTKNNDLAKIYKAAVDGFVTFSKQTKEFKSKELLTDLFQTTKLKGGFNIPTKDVDDPLVVAGYSREKYDSLRREIAEVNNRIQAQKREGFDKAEEQKDRNYLRELEEEIRPMQDLIDEVGGGTRGATIMQMKSGRETQGIDNVPTEDAQRKDTDAFDIDPVVVDLMKDVDNNRIDRQKAKEITNILKDEGDFNKPSVFDEAIARLKKMEQSPQIKNKIKLIEQRKQDLIKSREILQKGIFQKERLEFKKQALDLLDYFNTISRRPDKETDHKFFYPFMKMYDAREIALVMKNEISKNPDQTLNAILGTSKPLTTLSPKLKGKFDDKLNEVTKKISQATDDKLIKELKEETVEGKQEFLDKIIFKKSIVNGKEKIMPIINYRSFPPQMFDKVTAPFSSFLYDLINSDVFTYQQLHSWLRSKHRNYLDLLNNEYKRSEGIHRKYTLTQYEKLADDPNFFIDNPAVLRNNWFTSLYKAEQKYKVLGSDQVLVDAIKVPIDSTAKYFGIKDAYKSTSTFKLYKQWKRSRSEILNRKIDFDEGVTNPEKTMQHLLFAKFPYSAIKKIDDSGIDSMTEDDMRVGLTPDEKFEVLQQMQILSRSQADFRKRYFDDIAFAIAYRPQSAPAIFNFIGNEAANDFSGYMSRRFSNKLKIADSTTEKTRIERVSNLTEEEYVKIYGDKLDEIVEWYQTKGYSQEEALNAGFNYLVAAEKLQVVNKDEFEVLLKRHIDKDLASVREIKQAQAVENGSHEDGMGNSVISNDPDNVASDGTNSEKLNEDRKAKQNFFNSTLANKVMLKRSGGITSTVFDNLYVKTKVELLLKDFKNQFNVEPVKSINSIPKDVIDRAVEDGTRLEDLVTAKGLFDSKTGAIYLLSDNLESDADIEFTLFHELYGHYGLRSLMGKDLDTFLERKYRFNSKLRKEVDSFIERNNLTKDDKLVAIEEVLADEVALNKTGTFLTDLIKEIVAFFKSVGFDRIANYLLAISPNEVAFELARMKAREGNIQGPIGERFDIRLSNPNAEKEAEKSENLLSKEVVNKVKDLQTKLVNLRDKLYTKKLELKDPNVNSAENKKLLRQEIALTRAIEKLLNKPLSFRSQLTGKIINRDTREEKTVNKIFAKKDNDNYVALYYPPTDTFYILKNNEFVQRIEGYDDARDYMAKIAGGLTKISERYATPYLTSTGEYKLRDSFQFKESGKKRGVIGHWLRKQYYNHVNQFAPIMDMISDVMKFDTSLQGKGVAKALNNELLLNESKTGALLERFKIDFVRPLINLHKEAINLGATGEIINRFLHAEHAVERNKQISKITQGKKEDGSGMSDLEATKELNKYGLADPKLLKKFRLTANNDVPNYTSTLGKMSQMLNDMSRRKTNHLYNSGLISFGVLKKLDNYNSYRNLSSVQRGENKEQSPGDISVPGKYSVSGSGLQRALGRSGEGEVNDILINTILGTEQTLIRASKNSVSQKVLAFFENYQDTGRVLINAAPAYTRKINESGFIEIVQEEERNNNDKLYTRVNGVRYEMKFLDLQDEFQKSLYRALAGNPDIPEKLTEKVTMKMRGINKWIGSLVTTYNPAFIFVNGLRDIQTAFANMAADPRIGSKLAGKMMWNYTKGIRAALLYLSARSKNDNKISARFTDAVTRLLGQDINRDKGFDDDMDKIVEDFRRSGAMTFYLDRINSDSQMREIRKELNLTETNVATEAVRRTGEKISGIFHIIENLSTIFEIAPRFATYYTLTQEKTKTGANKFSKRDAAVYAKELTTNFNMRGADSSLRDLYIFFNPAVQGTRRLIQNYDSKQFRYIAGGLFVVGAVANMLARAGEEDEDISRYDMLPEYKKSTSLTFAVDKLFGSIPLAYGWNVPVNAGRLFFDQMFQGLHPVDAAQRLAVITAESTSPMTIGFESEKGLVPKIIKSLTPTALVPGVEIAFNENRFGSPISRQQISFLPKKADAYQGFGSVNPYLDRLAKSVNEATGGTEFVSGAIDVNPAYVEHLLNSYVPGLAATLFRKIGLDERIRRGELGLRKLGYSDLILNRFKAYPSEGWYYGAIERLNLATQQKYNEVKSNLSKSAEERIQYYKDPKNKTDIDIAIAIKNINNSLKLARTAKNKFKTANIIGNNGVPEHINIQNNIKEYEKGLFTNLIVEVLKYDKDNNTNKYKTIVFGRD